MKFIYVILANLFIIISVYSNTNIMYKIIAQNGDVSIDMKNKDVGTSLDLDASFFEIETSDESYIVFTSDDKIVILMPRSHLVVKNGAFYLNEGYIYFASRHWDKSIDVECYSKNDVKYSLNSKSFAMSSYDSDLHLYTKSSALKISNTIKFGINYLIEPYNKVKISPILEVPYSLSQKEISNLDRVCSQMMLEFDSYLNKDITRTTIKLFENTKYETEVHRIVHKNPGVNVFIFVPHGDERYSTVAAKMRISEPIISGSLTIVPIALTPAYNNHSRGIGSIDLNRQFKKNMQNKTAIDKVAYKYAKMLDEYDIDLVLALHEGNGKDEFFGDAIVFDKKKYQSKADDIVKKINKKIEPTQFKFKSMLHPMPTTFTYYAAEKGIDAFAIEISHKMPNEKKAIVKNAIIDEFFKIYGLY